MPDDPPGPTEFLGFTRVQALRHLAQGEASLMLLECLLLELCEQGLLQRDVLLKSIETAISAKRTLVEENDPAAQSGVAVGILSTVANSIAAGTRYLG